MEIRKIINNISYLTIILFVGLIGLLFFWSIYPYKPLVLTNVRLNKTEVNRGEHLLVSADYCKNTAKSADLFISFVDGIVYNTPPQVIDLESGCHHTTLSIYIPKALPVGSFMLKGVFKYKVNPIREIEVNHLSEKFTIVN